MGNVTRPWILNSMINGGGLANLLKKYPQRWAGNATEISLSVRYANMDIRH